MIRLQIDPIIRSSAFEQNARRPEIIMLISRYFFWLFLLNFLIHFRLSMTRSGSYFGQNLKSLGYNYFAPKKSGEYWVLHMNIFILIF